MKTIVHVGAASERAHRKDSEYHYFEPQSDPTLNRIQKNNNVHIYPYALFNFDGTKPFYVTRKRSCSSFYKPNLDLWKRYQKYQKYPVSRLEIEKTLEIKVRRMDSVFDKDFKIDQLTLDTQGSELQVLEGAGNLLHNVSWIKCEVQFLQLYKTVPLFKDVRNYLTKFEFKFDSHARIAKMGDTEFWADAIFKKR